MISLYIIIESNLSNEALDRAAAWLAENRPPYTTVMSGGQIDRAMQFAERVLPYTRVIFRVFPNDGVLKTFHYKASDYYTARVAPYEKWLRNHSIFWHVDNESAEDFLIEYAECTARVISIAVDNHVMTAVGAFATGNPREDQYNQLDPMWKALDEHHDMTIWACHEYHAQTPQLSGGHIYRYHLGWERCKQLKIAEPVTVIGEYGYLHSKDGRLDPEWGFRRDGLTGDLAAAMDTGYHRQWYAPNGVTACVYAFGGTTGKWASLNVDDDGYLKAITVYNKTLSPAPPTPNPPDETPDSAILAEMEAADKALRAAIDSLQVARLAVEAANEMLKAKGQT